MWKLRLIGLFIVAMAMIGMPSGQIVAQESQISCTFTANIDNLNLRSGPGTSFSRTGTLQAGETLAVTGRDVGVDGYIWWEGAIGWVRSDLGDSDCPSLCGDGVCEYGEDADSCSSDCSGAVGSSGSNSCLVPDCQSCYESIDCYPECSECTCDSNQFGCTTCYCEYPEGAGPVATTVTTSASDLNCTFTAAIDNINLREGPSTTFARLGQLEFGAELAITGRDVGPLGYVWWQSADGWVRSDLGDSDCPSLCGDGVCEYNEDVSSCASDCGSSSFTSTSNLTCTVPDCESCYESIDCYPDCDNCTCDANEFGCTTCFCSY